MAAPTPRRHVGQSTIYAAWPMARSQRFYSHHSGDPTTPSVRRTTLSTDAVVSHAHEPSFIPIALSSHPKFSSLSTPSSARVVIRTTCPKVLAVVHQDRCRSHAKYSESRIQRGNA